MIVTNIYIFLKEIIVFGFGYARFCPNVYTIHELKDDMLTLTYLSTIFLLIKLLCCSCILQVSFASRGWAQLSSVDHSHYNVFWAVLIAVATQVRTVKWMFTKTITIIVPRMIRELILMMYKFYKIKAYWIPWHHKRCSTWAACAG